MLKKNEQNFRDPGGHHQVYQYTHNRNLRKKGDKERDIKNI